MGSTGELGWGAGDGAGGRWLDGNGADAGARCGSGAACAHGGVGYAVRAHSGTVRVRTRTRTRTGSIASGSGSRVGVIAGTALFAGRRSDVLFGLASQFGEGGDGAGFVLCRSRIIKSVRK